MKANFESSEDVISSNFDAIAYEKFKEYSKSNPGHMVEQEFYQFLKDFFKDQIEVCEDLVNQEFYNINNKSNSPDGLNYDDFKDAFHDFYLLKH